MGRGILRAMAMKRLFRSRGAENPGPRCMLIVNPKSGSGKYREYLSFVELFFKRRGIPLEIRFTERPGHATQLARGASRAGFGVVIGAGGDGTITEVLNGLVGTDAKMAILPWGTGNVFALEMEFPRSLRRLCAVIALGRSMRLDTGKCGERHFLLMCGAGFDAYSLKQIEGLDIKRAAGKFAYVIGGIRAFSRYRFPEIEVELPGGRRERCSFALVSNTSRYGAFFSVSPKARPDDGLLDVFLYQEGGPFGMLRLAIKIILSAFRPSGFSSPSPHLKKTARFRVKNIRLSSAGIVYTQLDGDFASPLPVEISVAPSSIDCILPARTIRRLRNHRDRADA